MIETSDHDAYERQMIAYFSQCSKSLYELYDKEGEASASYREGYNRLSSEYDKFMVYKRKAREDTNQNMSSASAYIAYYKEMIKYYDGLLEGLNSQANSDTQANKENSSVIDGISAEQKDTSSDLLSDPRKMMQQYYDRYVETGKWDWASWNNYLSWIARTHPEWYSIFLESSQSVGIDWNQMYDKWKIAEEMTGGSSDVLNSQNTLLNSAGAIFRNLRPSGASSCRSPLRIDGEWTFCDVCQKSYRSGNAYAVHLRGVVHTQHVLRSVEPKQSIQPVQSEPVSFAQYPTEETHIKWLNTQYMNSEKSQFLLPGSFYCELCQVTSLSQQSLLSHLTGRRHRENVEIMNKTGNPALLKAKRPVRVKEVARIQAVLDVCTQALIGLSYIVEKQLPDCEECAYTCTLCDVDMSRSNVVKHVCARSHRRGYIKRHFPEMHAILIRDKSKKQIKNQRLEIFVSKIEDFEGRKRVNIEYLTAGFTEPPKRIWDDQHASSVKPLVPPPSRKRLKKKPDDKLKKIIDSSSDDQCGQSKKTVDSLPPPPTLSGDNDREEGEVGEDEVDAYFNGEDDGDSITSSSADDKSSDLTKEVGDDDDQSPEGESRQDSSPPPIGGDSAEKPSERESLRSNGYLDLDSLQPGTDQSCSNSTTNSPADHQFSSEADWALDRVRERRKLEHAEARRLTAAVSATAKSQVDRLQEWSRLSGAVAEDGADEASPSSIISPGQVLLPPTSDGRTDGLLPNHAFGQSTTGLNPASPSVPDEPAATTDLVETDPSSAATIALSSGAFDVILSAIGALKSSNEGQLPSDLLTALKASSASKSLPDSTTVSQSASDSPQIDPSILPPSLMGLLPGQVDASVNTKPWSTFECPLCKEPLITVSEFVEHMRSPSHSSLSHQFYLEFVDNKVQTDAFQHPIEFDAPCRWMTHFFAQFIQSNNPLTGYQWDWIGWTNCIQMIQQTSPAWFALFSILSRALGIDWDQLANLPSGYPRPVMQSEIFAYPAAGRKTLLPLVSLNPAPDTVPPPISVNTNVPPPLPTITTKRTLLPTISIAPSTLLSHPNPIEDDEQSEHQTVPTSLPTTSSSSADIPATDPEQQQQHGQAPAKSKRRSKKRVKPGSASANRCFFCIRFGKAATRCGHNKQRPANSPPPCSVPLSIGGDHSHPEQPPGCMGHQRDHIFVPEHIRHPTSLPHDAPPITPAFDIPQFDHLRRQHQQEQYYHELPINEPDVDDEYVQDDNRGLFPFEDDQPAPIEQQPNNPMPPPPPIDAVAVNECSLNHPCAPMRSPVDAYPPFHPPLHFSDQRSHELPPPPDQQRFFEDVNEGDRMIGAIHQQGHSPPHDRPLECRSPPLRQPPHRYHINDLDPPFSRRGPSPEDRPVAPLPPPMSQRQPRPLSPPRRAFFTDNFDHRPHPVTSSQQRPPSSPPGGYHFHPVDNIDHPAFTPDDLCRGCNRPQFDCCCRRRFDPRPLSPPPRHRPCLPRQTDDRFDDEFEPVRFHHRPPMPPQHPPSISGSGPTEPNMRYRRFSPDHVPPSRHHPDPNFITRRSPPPHPPSYHRRPVYDDDREIWRLEHQRRFVDDRDDMFPQHHPSFDDHIHNRPPENGPDVFYDDDGRDNWRDCPPTSRGHGPAYDDMHFAPNRDYHPSARRPPFHPRFPPRRDDRY